jgi:hypothetical protein
MAYSSFNKLRKVVNLFNIQVEREYLFPKEALKRIEPSEWLKTTILYGEVLGYESEKERSERLVSPVFTELSLINDRKVTVYSGHFLDVDKTLGLNGETDYLLALGKKSVMLLESPLFSVVEAKRQDMEHGMAQCTAQMIGMVRFNAMDKIELPYIYGATTDGDKWQFLRLKDNTLRIDEQLFHISDLPNLLGMLQMMVDDCRQFKL